MTTTVTISLPIRGKGFRNPLYLALDFNATSWHKSVTREQMLRCLADLDAACVGV